MASSLACSERRCQTQEWLHFGAWRWCIFFAGMGPVHFLAELLVHVLFLTAESHFFTLRYAFYYAVSVKVGSPLYCCKMRAEGYTPQFCDLRLRCLCVRSLLLHRSRRRGCRRLPY